MTAVSLTEPEGTHQLGSASRTAAEARPGGASDRWWPLLLVTASASALVAAAYWRSRDGSGGTALYWSGQLLIAVPVILICLARTPSRSQRVAGLALLAVVQALLARAYSPDRLRFPDELQHLRTLGDIGRTGHLYAENSALPISPRYPGLEVVTTAVHQLTGVSPVHAGMVLVAVAHLLVPILLIGFFEDLGLPTRVAAVAVLVWGTAPHVPYFTSLFVYGTLALPLMVAVLRLLTRVPDSTGAAVVTVTVFAALAVTHHVTAAAALALEAAVAVILCLRRPGTVAVRRLVTVVASCGLVLFLWVALVAPQTWSYLRGPLSGFFGEENSTQPSGGGHDGMASPRWEFVASACGLLVLLALIAVGLLLRFRENRAAVLTRWSLLGVAFPVVIVLRFAGADGAEIAGRLLTFMMLLAAVPAATALIAMWDAPHLGDRVRGALPSAAVLAVCSLSLWSITSGLPMWWERLPGDFKVSAFESGIDRSVDLVGDWASDAIRSGDVVACDVSTCAVVAAYSRATFTTTGSDVLYASDAEQMMSSIRSRGIRFVVLDTRVTEQLPITGAYLPGDPKGGRHDKPLDPRVIGWLDSSPELQRVYDNGIVQVWERRR